MRPPSVRVLDHDAYLCRTVRRNRILELEGYSVAVAEDGQAGLRAMERSPPALVLLDVKMPVLDGVGLSQVLKERGIRIPVILITGAPDLQTQRLVDEAGTAEFYTEEQP